MSFEQQFAEGIGYRKHFDPDFKLDDAEKRLLEKTFLQTSKKAMQEPFFSIRQGVCSEAATYAADNSVAPFNYQCLADSHTFLRACLDQKFLDERYMTLTVGDVSYNGNRLFNATRHTIEECVKVGISTADTPRFHVWLTLVDMTIIDLTIVNQLVASDYLPTPVASEQWLNVWRPERKGKFDYHPVLIDDDFLSRLQKRPH
ncbi:MAG: hypothetical protein AB8B97_15875 [Granulosicoccus sp.]